MGLILFAIGRFFSTIVTFVQLRQMVIMEGTSTIAEAVSAEPGTHVEADDDGTGDAAAEETPEPEPEAE